MGEKGDLLEWLLPGVISYANAENHEKIIRIPRTIALTHWPMFILDGAIIPQQLFTLVLPNFWYLFIIG